MQALIAAYLPIFAVVLSLRPLTRSQQDDQAFISEQLTRQYIDTGKHCVLLLPADLIAKLCFADLSAVFSLILPRS